VSEPAHRRRKAPGAARQVRQGVMMGLLDGKVAIVTGGTFAMTRRAASEYRSRSGGAVEPEELIAGLPQLYGTAPVGRLPDPAVHGA
jgi:hypothetical protein